MAELKLIETRKIPLSEVLFVQEFYPRPNQRPEKTAVRDYLSLLKGGETDLPPLELEYSENPPYRLLDGYHRYLAAHQAGLDEWECRLWDLRDHHPFWAANWFNRKHGRHLTRKQKRINCETLIEKGWETDVDLLAECLGVSKRTIYRWTQEIREKKERALAEDLFSQIEDSPEKSEELIRDSAQERGLSAKRVQRLIKHKKEKLETPPKSEERIESPEIEKAEEEIEEALEDEFEQLTPQQAFGAIECPNCKRQEFLIITKVGQKAQSGAEWYRCYDIDLSSVELSLTDELTLEPPKALEADENYRIYCKSCGQLLESDQQEATFIVDDTFLNILDDVTDGQILQGLTGRKKAEHPAVDELRRLGYEKFQTDFWNCLDGGHLQLVLNILANLIPIDASVIDVNSANRELGIAIGHFQYPEPEEGIADYVYVDLTNDWKLTDHIRNAIEQISTGGILLALVDHKGIGSQKIDRGFAAIAAMLDIGLTISGRIVVGLQKPKDESQVLGGITMGDAHELILAYKAK